jgi:outer membrane protein assembly factor BamE (lipoprotein component of BamABCDE complex)
MKRSVILTFIAALCLSGCAGSPVRNSSIAEVNRDNMLDLNVGQSKKQVLLIMGEPYKTEAYSMDGEPLEFWLYITQGAGARSLNDSHFTPLAFRDGALQGWGRNYYDRVIRVKADIAVEQK